MADAACCPACVREWPDGNVGLFCPTCGLVVLHGTLDSWRAPTRSRLLLENAYLRDFIRAQQEKKEKAE